MPFLRLIFGVWTAAHFLFSAEYSAEYRLCFFHGLVMVDIAQVIDANVIGGFVVQALQRFSEPAVLPGQIGFSFHFAFFPG